MQVSFNNYYHDPEYMRIIQELKRLGITPSGNKFTDKTRLQVEKNKLINKVSEQKENSEFLETLFQTQALNSARELLEEERLGAMSIAELNKIYFGL